MGSFSKEWHYGDSPDRYSEGSLSTSANGSTVSASASVSTHLRPSYWGFSGYDDVLHLYIDGVEVASKAIGCPEGSADISGSRDVGRYGDVSVELKIQCGDTGCDSGYYYNYYLLNSETVTTVNPYSPPSYDLFSITDIVRLDRDKLSVNYKINGGTNGIDWAVLRLNTGKDYGLSKSKGDSLWADIYPKVSDGLSHGSSYTAKVRLSDAKNEFETRGEDFYTYQEPRITGISSSSSKINVNKDSTTFTMSGINNRMWTSYEDDFYTEIHCTLDGNNVGNGWTKVGSAGLSNTFTLSSSDIKNYINMNCNNKTVVLHARRVNSRANWYSNEVTCSFLVYYSPVRQYTGSSWEYRDLKNATTDDFLVVRQYNGSSWSDLG